jgi:pimeloyl-ACP methyl ester carboxylesterase
MRRLPVLGLLFVTMAIAVGWYICGELIAPVQRPVGPAPADLAAESVTFPSLSGSSIHGWFSPGSTGQGAVLLLHGVRGDRRDMLSRAEFLHGLGYAVLLIDFQAHGESPGQHITFGALESECCCGARVSEAATSD